MLDARRLRLLRELAPQRKSENIPAHLSGEIMRAVLTGLPYPRALPSQATLIGGARNRNERDARALRHLRVSLVETRLHRVVRVVPAVDVHRLAVAISPRREEEHLRATVTSYLRQRR